MGFLSKLFENDESRTNREIEKRIDQARKHNIHEKIKLIMPLSSKWQDKWRILNDGDVEFRCNLTSNYKIVDNPVEYELEVYVGGTSHEHRVYACFIPAYSEPEIRGYIPGAWEQRLDALVPKATAVQDKHLAQLRASRKKDFGL